MRVAFLTFYPSDPRRIPGGIRMVSYNLVQGLRAYHDLELHVIHCHSDIAEDRTVREGDVTVHYLAMPRQRIIPNLMTSIGRMMQQVRTLKPDLVHAHAGHFAYAGVRSGYPTVYTIHGVLARERQVYRSTWFDRARYALLAYYEARALPRVQQVVAISPYVMQAYAHVRTPWVRIDNPVPEDFFTLADRAEPGRVLYVGSITEIKDLLTLLRAIECVRRTYPQVVLRIAGRATSAAYERRVRDYVATHQLGGQVQFLGLLERAALLEEYAHCAVVALSSVQENAPMAVIEGMAAGKPVVATRVGGVPDLIADGETGWLVPAGDDRALAERLGLLLADPALARRMGQRARAVAQARFSLERIAGAYYALYQRVLVETHARQDARRGTLRGNDANLRAL